MIDYGRGLIFPDSWADGPPDEPDPPEETVIPDDGREHPCVCGEGSYSVWDCDGWAPPMVVDMDRLDVDCNGFTEECRHCERALKPALREVQES